MTSLLCVRRPGGSVQVHDNNRVCDISQPQNCQGFKRSSSFIHNFQGARNQNLKLKRPHSMTATPTAVYVRSASHLRPASSVDQDALIDHTLKLQEWLNNRSIKTVQEKSDVEAKNTKKMYDSVLETEDSFVKDMDSLVAHRDMLNTRKKEMLHKKWNESVHEPIRHQVVKEMYSPGFTELCRRKRELHKEYLEHVNKKGHVFLDTIAPDEYYALSLHPVRPSLLTAETNHLRDPLLSQERERSDEDRIIFQCETGSKISDRDMAQIRLPPLPLVPLGRHGTECRTWLAMPMGDIESPVRLASRKRMGNHYNDSHFNFERWGNPVPQTVVDGEMAIQKKRAFPQESIAAQIAKSSARTLNPSATVQCGS